MERISVKKVHQLARQLMFSLSEQEAKDIVSEFDTLLSQLDLLDRIDTSDCEELVYPFETPTTFFREDVVDHVMDVKDVFLNAPKVENQYFVIPKVVKDNGE